MEILAVYASSLCVCTCMHMKNVIPTYAIVGIVNVFIVLVAIVKELQIYLSGVYIVGLQLKIVLGQEVDLLTFQFQICLVHNDQSSCQP